MALQSSGLITLAQVQSEFGGSNPISMSEYYRGGAYTTTNNTGVPTSGSISLSNFYNTVKSFSFTISSNTQEANLSTLATAAGWDGSAPLLATIASGVYVWSDDTAIPGLIINVPNCTVTNNGYIIGRGGNGADAGGNGQAGGPAINVTTSGVSIINAAGAFIAGGGGGGGSGYALIRGAPNYIWSYGGAGGGAGGGTGQGGLWVNFATSDSATSQAAAGGAIGQVGATAPAVTTFASGGSAGSATPGSGGGAGGGGGLSPNQVVSSGGGGGRIIPGVGGVNNADGGSAGGAGQSSTQAGGGGGWGASGGNGGNGATGGAGGAAITGTSPSLTNNGTIYGSTV